MKDKKIPSYGRPDGICGTRLDLAEVVARPRLDGEIRHSVRRGGKLLSVARIECSVLGLENS